MELGLGETLARHGVRDAKLLAAMMRVERARFLPPDQRARAGLDEALPLGPGLVAPAPSVVATMIGALGITAGTKALEIGPGSGYEAAVLAELGARVWSVATEPLLVERAALAFAAQGLRIFLRSGELAAGWAAEAPFSAILVTTPAPEPPPPLLRQLAPEGRLVMPVGPPGAERLVLCRRLRQGFVSTALDG